jgi:transposase
MRGRQEAQPRLFYSIDVESRIRPTHPLRDVKRRVDAILADMSSLFDQAYSKTGRPGIPPEQLLKALLLQAFYSIRSEAQLVERIDTDLLFRWFLDLDPADEVFDATAYAHNRPRLDEYGIITAFFDAVVQQAIDKNLCSEHFSVDGTIIESYASTKSFRPKAESSSDDGDSTLPPNAGDGNSFKPRNPDVDFHGQKRTNDTHMSTTDPEAKLFRKGNGKPAHLAHLGHALTENRYGLIMQVAVTDANRRSEIDAAVDMTDRHIATHGHCPTTIGSDRGYDSGEYYISLEDRGITPHGAMSSQEPKPETTSKRRRPNAYARQRMKERQQTDEYRLSQRCRKKVEECFGWMKCIGGMARSRHVGRWKISQQLHVAAAAFNLVRLSKLRPA